MSLPFHPWTATTALLWVDLCLSLVERAFIWNWKPFLLWIHKFHRFLLPKFINTNSFRPWGTCLLRASTLFYISYASYWNILKILSGTANLKCTLGRGKLSHPVMILQNLLSPILWKYPDMTYTKQNKIQTEILFFQLFISTYL